MTLALGRVCVLDIDVQGAEIVKRSTLNAVYVFVSPPSMAELEKRLRGRGEGADCRTNTACTIRVDVGRFTVHRNPGDGSDNSCPTICFRRRKESAPRVSNLERAMRTKSEIPGVEPLSSMLWNVCLLPDVRTFLLFSFLFALVENKNTHRPLARGVVASASLPRGTEKEASIQTRMANAKKEMAKTSVRGFFHRVIVNDNLEKAYDELRMVIHKEILLHNQREGGGARGRPGGGLLGAFESVVEGVGLPALAAPYVAAVLLAGVAVGVAAYYKQPR